MEALGIILGFFLDLACVWVPFLIPAALLVGFCYAYSRRTTR